MSGLREWMAVGFLGFLGITGCGSSQPQPNAPTATATRTSEAAPAASASHTASEFAFPEVRTYSISEGTSSAGYHIGLNVLQYCQNIASGYVNAGLAVLARDQVFDSVCAEVVRSHSMPRPSATELYQVPGQNAQLLSQYDFQWQFGDSHASRVYCTAQQGALAVTTLLLPGQPSLLAHMNTLVEVQQDTQAPSETVQVTFKKVVPVAAIASSPADYERLFSSRHPRWSYDAQLNQALSLAPVTTAASEGSLVVDGQPIHCRRLR